MAFHHFEFDRRELSGLEQDAVGQTDFADVVKLRCKPDDPRFGFGKAEFAREDCHIAANADDVAAGGVVTIFSGAG